MIDINPLIGTPHENVNIGFKGNSVKNITDNLESYYQLSFVKKQSHKLDASNES
jgi:hypothetical protein